MLHFFLMLRFVNFIFVKTPVIMSAWKEGGGEGVVSWFMIKKWKPCSFGLSTTYII